MKTPDERVAKEKSFGTFTHTDTEVGGQKWRERVGVRPDPWGMGVVAV